MSHIFRSTKKRIVISFDYDHDKEYRYLLSALKANKGSAIDFEDLTPGAINSDNVSSVKRVLTSQIRGATHLLVIVGDYANTRHPDSALIGDRNWQWWEINKAKEEKKRLIAVKIHKDDEAPEPLKNAGATWALSYNVDAIVKAIDAA
jgi:hypothetical protein